MRRKLQITNHKHKRSLADLFQIVNETSIPGILGIPKYNIRNYKKKTKGSYGLHQGAFKLQTMTALMKSFCGGVQGGRFFQKESPLAKG
jgi:hypothetical protein